MFCSINYSAQALAVGRLSGTGSWVAKSFGSGGSPGPANFH